MRAANRSTRASIAAAVWYAQVAVKRLSSRRSPTLASVLRGAAICSLAVLACGTPPTSEAGSTLSVVS